MKQRVLILLLLSLFVFAPVAAPQPETGLAVGSDRLFDVQFFKWIRGKRVGLITNATGRDSALRSTAERISHHPNVRLVALFAPEHGISGTEEAGKRVADQPKVISLYGTRRAPTVAMLSQLDVLVYDIQDVGARYYTYISTLFESMKAAARAKVPFVVLDRPDPIAGNRVEGPVLDPEFHSFVGIFPLPVRYGMTPGELARLFNSQAHLGCDLKIVPLRGWHRKLWFDQLPLQWILPSPNMPTLATATVYPGFCLIEGTNLSEGRGTTRPFELIGAPWLNETSLAKRLNELNLKGVYFRPQSFTPSFSKYKGRVCHGVQIHVLDRRTFRPLDAALYLLEEVQALHPGKLTFHGAEFDRLIGNRWVRSDLLAGRPIPSIVARWQQGLEHFKRVRGKYLLYR